ncbi:hypothetical protein M436DRAFT_62078 [Aureobasidium namibiae CBS 147.97]|uniref:Uncharacterized protein n=1 Tax=Aureobasidium namibiae CBS 147.97 TaxID=1043004 RepID=A0A074WW11_9PEZI
MEERCEKAVESLGAGQNRRKWCLQRPALSTSNSWRHHRVTYAKDYIFARNASRVLSAHKTHHGGHLDSLGILAQQLRCYFATEERYVKQIGVLTASLFVGTKAAWAACPGPLVIDDFSKWSSNLNSLNEWASRISIDFHQSLLLSYPDDGSISASAANGKLSVVSNANSYFYETFPCQAASWPVKRKSW